MAAALLDAKLLYTGPQRIRIPGAGDKHYKHTAAKLEHSCTTLSPVTLEQGLQASCPRQGHRQMPLLQALDTDQEAEVCARLQAGQQWQQRIPGLHRPEAAQQV